MTFVCEIMRCRIFQQWLSYEIWPAVCRVFHQNKTQLKKYNGFWNFFITYFFGLLSIQFFVQSCLTTKIRNFLVFVCCTIFCADTDSFYCVRFLIEKMQCMDWHTKNRIFLIFVWFSSVKKPIVYVLTCTVCACNKT